MAGSITSEYGEFEKKWNKITSVTLNGEDINIGSEFYEDRLMELYEEVDTLEFGEAKDGD
jgi:hypothetical protein